jgi:hypothetical protein
MDGYIKARGVGQRAQKEEAWDLVCALADLLG